MAGNTFGRQFTITTWGESHGKALGAVIDGCPAGLLLSEADLQVLLDRRRPGQSSMTTARKEDDQAEILSGVFEGKTTGTPISVIVPNGNQRSKDYANVAHAFRPGHADYTFYEKYGIRDYRGGGRSSGRETIGRVIGGAVAKKILNKLGITALCYTKAIGPVSCESFDENEIFKNALFMPDAAAAAEAESYVKQCRAESDSVGGIIECRVNGIPTGIGEPVFEKLDANLAKAMLSIGAVKGFEIGSGFEAASMRGSENNDGFYIDGTHLRKESNNAGGVLGGISDGFELVFRVAVKPTPSIARPQSSVLDDGSEISMEVIGRHDPVIVPRAVVVVEAMAYLTLLDLIFASMPSRVNRVEEFFR